MQSRLVGRELEREEGRRLIECVAAGDGGTLVIHGPAGIGKTELLDHLCELAQARGLALLHVSCAAELRDIPLFEVSRALRSFVTQLEASEASLLGGLERDLAPLLDELGPDGDSREWSESDSARAAARTNEALAILLGRLSRHRPVVVAVDDVHWGDRSTVRLLRWLRRQLDSDAVLIALSLRDDEPLAADGELAALIAGATRLEVGPLSEMDSRRLLAVISPRDRPLGVDAATSLIDRAAGNPLYLVQAARTLDGHRDGAPLPRVIGEMLAARLAGMPPDVREAVSAAAVIGPAFEIADLAVLLGTRIEPLLPVLRAAVEGRVLRETPLPDELAFVHPLVREAALGLRLLAERVRLERAVLELMSNRRGASAAELALHAEGAGEVERCAEFAEAAADAAWRRGAFHECAAQWDRVLRATREGGREPTDTQLETAARACMAAGRGAAAAALLNEVASRLGARGDVLGAAEAEARSVRASLRTDVAGRLDDVIGRIEGLGPTRELAFVLATRAQSLVVGGSGGQPMYEMSVRALEMARATGSDEALAVALLGNGAIVANAVDFDQGVALLQQCVEVARRCDSAGEEQSAVTNLILLYCKACQWDDAAALARGAAQRWMESGALRRAGQALGRLADVERRQGDWPAALAHANDGILLLDREDIVWAGQVRHALAGVLVDMGDWAQAERVIPRKIETADSTTFLPAAHWLALQAEARYARADLEGAARAGEAIFELWSRASEAYYGMNYTETYVAALADLGRVDEAAAVVQEMERRLG